LLFKPSNRRLMPLLKIFGESPMLPKEVAGVSVSFVSREILDANDETVSWVRSCEALPSRLRKSAGDASEKTDNLFRFLGDGEWAGVSAKAATASWAESSDQSSKLSFFEEAFRNDGLAPKKRLVDSSDTRGPLLDAIRVLSEHKRCRLGGLRPPCTCALIVRRAGCGAELGAGMLATRLTAGGRIAGSRDADQDAPGCASSKRRGPGCSWLCLKQKALTRRRCERIRVKLR
jgi:hypothetical protein